ncbi:hypothetical protein CRYPD_1033 [uncultured Candidatus Thioglobus sp.]|nr:hypothetical protein CRYPD_1033 [uncultured Candidatus Thioglobus sp.]
MNNHQKSTFHLLGNFLNPALALLGQGLRKSPIWKKLNFANHPYLCKGLILFIVVTYDNKEKHLFAIKVRPK